MSFRMLKVSIRISITLSYIKNIDFCVYWYNRIDIKTSLKEYWQIKKIYVTKIHAFIFVQNVFFQTFNVLERTLHDFNKVIKHIIIMVINCNTTLRGEDYSNLHPSPNMIFKEGCKFLHWKIKISSQELQCYSEWYHYTVIQIIHSKCDT